MNKTSLSFGLILALALPGLATAAPVLIQTREVGTLTSHCCWDNWLNIQTASGPNNFYQVNSWSQSWATVNAVSAQYGALGGHVSAGSQSHGYTASGGEAKLRDGWHDLFTITSNTLALGTAVQLQLTVELDGTIQALNPDGVANSAEGGGRMTAAFHSGGWDAPWLTGVDVQFGHNTNTFGTLSGSYSNQVVINSQVGAIESLVGDLYLWYGQSNGPDARDWFSGFTTGNARFYVDVLTAGASYSTASGVNYASVVTAVPEPAAGALVLTGLSLLGTARRKSRRTA